MAPEVRKFTFLIACVLTPVATWSPTIGVVQDTKGRSLIVTVGGVLHFNTLHSLRLCFRLLTGFDCVHATVAKLESTADEYRYRVTGLETSKTYYLYIKPLGTHLVELDDWILMPGSVHVDYPPSSSLTTTRPTTETTTAPNTPPPPDFSPELIGLSAALFVILFVVFIVCLIHFRKQIAALVQKWGVFGCCTPRLVRYLPRIDVMIIYMTDNAPYFESLVREHLKFLQQYMNLQYQDLLSLLKEAEGKNMARDTSAVIDEVCGNKRVLVYVSPSLGQQLCTGGGTGRRGADHTFLPQLLKALAAPTRGRGKKKKPILIFTGCYQEDMVYRNYFERDPCFQQLKRFAISSQNAEFLVPPHDLLRSLSGCQHTAVAEGEWETRGQGLLYAAQRLREAIVDMPHDHYPQPLQLNDGACILVMENLPLLRE